MCSEPVTLGGGITMENGALARGVGVEQPARYPVLVTASLYIAGRVLGG